MQVAMLQVAGEQPEVPGYGRGRRKTVYLSDLDCKVGVTDAM